MTHNSAAAELWVITQGFELTLNSKKEWLAYPRLVGAIDYLAPNRNLGTQQQLAETPRD